MWEQLREEVVANLTTKMEELHQVALSSLHNGLKQETTRLEGVLLAAIGSSTCKLQPSLDLATLLLWCYHLSAQ